MTRPSAAATAAEAPYAGATYWDAAAEDMSEAVFQAHVIREAEALGYRIYHTHDARRSAKGFPDLVLVRPAGWAEAGYQHQARCAGVGVAALERITGRVVFIELKAARGKLTDDQHAWRDDLRAAGAEIYSPVRPDAFDRLLALLAAPGGAA